MLRVLVFGTGNYSRKIFDKIKKKYEIVAFLDNQIKKQNTYILYEDQEYLVKNPNEIKSCEFDKIVIASTEYASEMFSQILRLGVREHDIIVDFVSTIQKVFVLDLMKMQLNQFYEENRLDVFVKYMAIENYYGKNNYGYALYKKMQKARLNLSDIETEMVLDKFRKLIESVEKKGLEEDSYIICDEKMRIMDGAHRVAFCLYFNIPFVQVKIVPRKFECDYSKTWFWENDFSIGEIKEIYKRQCNIFENDKENMTAILWSSAHEYFENITDELSELVEIKEIIDKEYGSFSQLQNIVRAVYSIDDIETWKIEKKLEYMKNYVPKIRIIKFKMQKPLYRLKGGTYLPLSIAGERLKKIIRTRFKLKVHPYFYDIIIHIADNYYQSRIIDKIFWLDLDISSCFESLKNNSYALTKMDVPYMPENFPYSFPVHKDADLICSGEDFEVVKKKIIRFCEKYAKKYDLNIRKISENKHFRIRLEYLDYLIYQFDVTTTFANINEQFIKDSIKYRKCGTGYYSLDQNYEVIIRFNEIIMYPRKTHHMQFLKNIGFDIKWIKKYMICDHTVINEAIHVVEEYGASELRRENSE